MELRNRYIVLKRCIKRETQCSHWRTHSSGWGLCWFYNWIISLSDHLLSGRLRQICIWRRFWKHLDDVDIRCAEGEIVEGKVYDSFISLIMGTRRLGSFHTFQTRKLYVDHHVSNESLQTRIISCRMRSTSEPFLGLLMRTALRKKSHLLYMGLCMIPKVLHIPYFTETGLK